MSDTRLSVQDGLVMRESGEWAKDKLYYVGRYMQIFSAGMKIKWGARGYLDLMAGPGRCYVRETLDEFDGSAVLACATTPSFDALVFVERDQTNADALAHRTIAAHGRRTVIAADCNAPETIAVIRQRLSSNMLFFGFVDLLGFDVAFDTIAAIVADRRMDLAITFHVGDVNRNIGDALQTVEGERLDRFFGASGWREVVHRFERGQIDRADLPTALADYYGARLQTIGYVVLEQLHRTMRNNRNAPLYRLLLASGHKRGGEFFRKIAAIEHDGQRGLF
jgi:three-Cys-motif partner protein